jgi:CheY-like chemotaxis protein
MAQGDRPVRISGRTTPEAALPLLGPYLRVLHINDSTDDQILFQAACRLANAPFNWHVTDSAAKGISYLKTLVEHSKTLPVCWPDLVLLDILMPPESGLEVLKFIRATPALEHLTVIILTGVSDPVKKEESMAFGADFFLLKPPGFQEAVALAKDLYNLIRHAREGGSPPPGFAR